MNKIILHKKDFVIITKDDTFYKFPNGQIVIYGDKEEALKDCLNGERVVSCTALFKRKQTELIENIEKYE